MSVDSGSIDAIESWLDEISWNSRTRFLVAFSHCRLLGAVAGRSKLDSLERAKLDSCDRGIGR